jgi:hypothetical protein
MDFCFGRYDSGQMTVLKGQDPVACYFESRLLAAVLHYLVSWFGSGVFL